MYTQITKNQEKLQPKSKTPLIMLFSQEYYSSCTPTIGLIYKYICSYRLSKWTKLKRQTIADACGCSIRTVSTAIAKFHADTVVFKSQENKFAPNDFEWGPRSFLPVMDLYSEEEKDCSLCYCTHNKSLNINLDLSNKTITINNSQLRACAREGGFPEKLSIGLLVSKPKREIMEIGDEELSLDCIKNDLLAQMSLTPVEEMKLNVYQYEALKWAYKEYQSLLQSKKGVMIHDVFAWFLSQCKKYSIAHSLPMDWAKFYDLCRISSLDSQERSVARPLVVPPSSNRKKETSKSDNTAKANYKPTEWKPDADNILEQSEQETIMKAKQNADILTKELKTREKTAQIKDPFYVNFLNDILKADLKKAYKPNEAQS